MNDQQLLERLAIADTYPTEAPLPEGLRSDVVLRDIERRMDLEPEERTRRTTPAPRRWTGMWAAAAAFAVVVVVGLAAIALNGSDESPSGPATPNDPPVVDTTVAETEAYVADVLEGLTDGDIDALVGRYSPDIRFFGSDQDAYRRYLKGLFVYGVEMDSTWTLDHCTAVDDARFDATCFITRTSPFDVYAPYGQLLKLGIAVENDEITFLTADFPDRQFLVWWEGELAFMVWLEATHPDVYDTLYSDPTSIGAYSPRWEDPVEEASLMIHYVREYQGVAGSG